MKTFLKTISIAFFFALVVWFFDAYVDHIAYYKGSSFLDLLIFDLPKHEIYERSVIFVLFGIFGIIMGFFLYRNEKTQESFRMSYEKYQSIFNTAPDLIISLDRNGNILDVNNRIEEKLGYSKDEVKNKNMSSIIHPDYINKAKTALQSVMETGSSYDNEYKLLKKDGTPIDVRATSAALRDKKGKYSYTITSIQDITDRKKFQNEILEQKEFAEKLLNIAQVIILLLDKNGDIVTFNPYLEQITGYSLEEVQGKNWFDIFIPEGDRSRIKEIFSRATSGMEVSSNINSILTKKGRELYIEWNGKALESAEGDFLGLLSIGMDVTGRMHWEKEIKESEAKFRVIFENASDGIMLVDPDTMKIIMANKKMSEMLKYNNEEMIGLTILDMHPEDVKDFVMKNFFEMVSAGGGLSENVPFKRKDGERLYVDISSYIIKISGKNYMVGILRDVTEKRKLEKMKDSLIRDVSHTLKTPIAMIEMAYNMAGKGMKINDQKQIEKSRYIMFNNIRRVRKDLDNILGMFLLSEKKEIEALQEVSLQEKIDLVINDIKYLIAKKNLKVSIDVMQGADKIVAVPKDIEMLLFNIIDNSVKFTNEGGFSVICTLKGDNFYIEISDTGCGIGEDDIANVFQKFYKRHAAIPGAGLGLSICKGIVDKYNGTIDIVSEGVNNGTRVVIEIPKEVIDER